MLAHDCLVVIVAAESSDEDDSSAPDAVLASVEVVVVVDFDATVVASAPIEPSKATTPHASTKVARTAAAMRRRNRRIRQARAASFSWATAEGMP